MLVAQAWEQAFQMPQIAIVAGTAVGGLIAISAIIATYWSRVQRTRSDNALKRAMVDQGLSADEIERILAAESPDPELSRR